MYKTIFIFLLGCFFVLEVDAQSRLIIKDSTELSLHAAYNEVSVFHKKFFGENYRADWAMQVKLPLIKISDLAGGLKPVKADSQSASRTLYLKDASGKQWVLRSVEKYTARLAPDVVQKTIYEKWLNDNFSALHPFAGLMVPVLADAVKVPHTNPVIGVVASDESLGEFSFEFVGTVCILEELSSGSDIKLSSQMLQALNADNSNQVDRSVFLRARLLDWLIADWHKGEELWQWKPERKDGATEYDAVPQNRDQAFYVNEGVVPKLSAKLAGLSFLNGFKPVAKHPEDLFIRGSSLNQQLLNQYSYNEWMHLAKDFVLALPDEVLQLAVNRLPEASRQLSGGRVFETLKSRRDYLLAAMDNYYRFLYHITDIRTSDAAEKIELSETSEGLLAVSIHSLSSTGKNERLLYKNTFQPDITKEIRLFIGGGEDVVVANTPTNGIKVRVIGGQAKKTYDVKATKSKLHIYENKDDHLFVSENRIRRHLSNDTLNTVKPFTNIYANSSGFSPAVDLRSVDGLLPGLSYKIKREGFRKEPYGSMQKFSVLKSLTTKNVILKYQAEFKSISRNTDLLIGGVADINGNVINFFGRGNETEFERTGDFRKFYRANFSYYQLDPSLRFNLKNGFSISTGPSFQYYHFDAGANNGRFINSELVAGQYPDLSKEKAHGGLFLNIDWDTRDNVLMPAKGLHFNLGLHGYEGLNDHSDSYAQVFPQLAFYKSLDAQGKVVIAERLGGGFTKGLTAFYQSAFLGSQDNLLGFRKFRFAGDHTLYNNLELRVTIPNFLRYLFPGKIGFIGFYDAGRVWIKNEKSSVIHHGYGLGGFFNPLNHEKLFLRIDAGFSKEGLQPVISLRQRF